MTLEQKEVTVESWRDYPWPEFLESVRWRRATRLMTHESEAERADIEREYEATLDRMLSHHKVVR
jgi:hypothetical protein